MMRTKRTALTATAALALLLILSGTAVGQRQIDETRAVAADVTVIIENVSGSVSVTGWDRNEIHITGRLGKGTEDLEIEGDGKRLEIRVVLPDHARNVKGTDLEIQLPKKSKVEVETISADIDLDKVDGRIHLDSVSGDISARGKPAKVDASSISGEIVLLVESDHVRANSISGDLRLDGVHGNVDVETVSGDTEITGGSFERFHFSSVSGDVRFAGDLEANGSYTFACHSGDVVLILPEAISADFDISSFSGDISNAFGPEGKRTSKFTPGTELRFSTGSGGADVRVETFSGDVEIRRM
jgi:DUF4097 and DUF4098 domain-containing protein YvlB